MNIYTDYHLDNQINGLRNRIAFIKRQIKREQVAGESSADSIAWLNKTGNEYDAVLTKQVDRL